MRIFSTVFNYSVQRERLLNLNKKIFTPSTLPFPPSTLDYTSQLEKEAVPFLLCFSDGERVVGARWGEGETE